MAEYIQTGYRSGYGEAIVYIQFASLNSCNYILSSDDIKSRLSQAKPIIVLVWEYHGVLKGKGHALVLYGYVTHHNTTRFLIRDPSPVGEGESRALVYSNLVNYGVFTWKDHVIAA